MNLRDLEYKPEDFLSHYTWLEGERICDIANRILSEKLSKTPYMYHEPVTRYWIIFKKPPGISKVNYRGKMRYKFRGRLILMEEIE